MTRRSAVAAGLAAGALAGTLACGGGTNTGAAAGPAPRALAPARTEQASGTTALLQAVSPVDERVVWVSGHQGTYARTTDGGATWRAARVPDADTLQFRDVHAVSAETAWLLAAGPGEMSRIYKTTDGGGTWVIQFVNRDSAAFFDCLDFWDADHGAAYSDAVEGRMLVLVTEDGGATWTRLPDDALPAPQPGEGGFAASGTCLVAGADGHGWIGTGNAPAARVLRTTDRGRTWTPAPVPIPAGEAAGITSVAFRDTRHGVALGGNLGKPDEFADVVALTADGGRTWTLGGRPSFTGAIFGGVYAGDGEGAPLVAVGPKGASYSLDDGRSWVGLDSMAYWGVGFASAAAGWAVGPGGRITKFSLR